MKKTILLLLYSIFSFLFASGQKKTEELYKGQNHDSVVNILKQKSETEDLSIHELYQLSKSFQFLKKYANGLVISDKLIAACMIAKDSVYLAKSYNIKCEHLIDINQIDEGIKFCEMVNPLFRSQDSLQLELLYFKWGMLYFQNGEYEKALNIYNKIKSNHLINHQTYIHNYAIIFLKLGNYKKARHYFNKNVLEVKKTKDSAGLAIVYMNIGNLLMKEELWEKAKNYLDSSTSATTKHTLFSRNKSRFYNYYTYYKNKKNIDTMIVYLDSIRISDELIFNKKMNEKILEIETASKRESNLKHKVKITDNKLEKSQQQMLWSALILLIIILILFVFIFSFKYKNIKSAHENILIEQKLLRSQMTPHFIFNSLSVLQGIILNKEETKAITYLSKFSKLLRITLENSRDKLVPLDWELKALENYIDVQNMGADIGYQYTIVADKNINQEDISIPPMMIQPFVENAIEHAFINQKEDKEITIKINFEDKKLICVISDNGIGVNTYRKKSPTEKKSLATTITKERLKIFSKEFKVESSIKIEDRKVFGEKGTLVTLVLPYKMNKND